MGTGILLGLSLAFATGDWIAVGTSRRWLEYICKPLTLLGLIVWFVVREPVVASAAGSAFAVGLGFSLLGDIVLMLPADTPRRHLSLPSEMAPRRDRRRRFPSSPAKTAPRRGRFRQGLAAFLAAHVAYIVAFNQGGLIVTPTSLAIAGGVALLAGGLLRTLLPALAAAGRSGLRIPVAVYAVVLGLTAWSAMVTLLREDWFLLAALPVAFGGAAFLIADSALAIHRFLRPIPGGRLLEHISYHLAQFSMAVGMSLILA